MAVPFLSSSLQLTSSSPILFTKVTTPIIHNQFNQRTCTVPKKPRLHPLRRYAAAGTAVVDQTEGKEGGGEVLLNPEEGKRVEVADYDWTEEWYPLYLTKNIPDDAPLGLTYLRSRIGIKKNILSATAVVLTALAILVVSRQWKAVLLGSAALFSAAAYACLRAIQLNTNNFIRTHRRL